MNHTNRTTQGSRTMNGTTDSNSRPHLELSESEIENELLVSALHATQEKLEEATIQLETNLDLVDKLSRRLARLNTKFPNYWEARSIKYKISEVTPGSKKIQWEVVETELAGKSYELINFETTCKNGLAGIKILSSSKGLDFFSLHNQSKELSCSPVNGSYSAPENKLISSIGTSDWKIIRDLVKKLKFSLTTNVFPDMPEDAVKELANGLNTLSAVLEKWPSVLRYDNVELTQYTNSSEYQALGLRFTNIELASKKCPSFSYYLSSVNEPSNSFGQFPRLEFHENMSENFEKWFCETSDDRGQRLELRFASPNQMDIDVWKKLSSSDQFFIAANISTLPDILQTLRSKGSADLDWDAWLKMSSHLNKILASTLNP